MIGHLPRIFDLAGALLTSCASVSFAASSDVFTAEVLVIRLEAVYGVAHCYAGSFSPTRGSRCFRPYQRGRAGWNSCFLFQAEDGIRDRRRQAHGQILGGQFEAG